MRDIKFRAWDQNKKKWIENFEISPCGNIGYTDMFETYESLYNAELMQYTGVTDMIGKEIYEGDIWKRGNFKAIVVFKYSGWAFEPATNKRISYPNFYGQANTGIIIGNIYENPELIKDIK